MIKVIYGAKGTGKTKQMIDAANEAVKSAKGHLVFITDTKRGMYDLEREVRFIDVTDFDVAGEAALCGFIKGVIAGNHDNEYIYIDGVMRIAGKKASELGAFFYMLDKVSEENISPLRFPFRRRKKNFPILFLNICNRQIASAEYSCGAGEKFGVNKKRRKQQITRPIPVRFCARGGKAVFGR